MLITSYQCVDYLSRWFYFKKHFLNSVGAPKGTMINL